MENAISAPQARALGANWAGMKAAFESAVEVLRASGRYNERRIVMNYKSAKHARRTVWLGLFIDFNDDAEEFEAVKNVLISAPHASFERQLGCVVHRGRQSVLRFTVLPTCLLPYLPLNATEIGRVDLRFLLRLSIQDRLTFGIDGCVDYWAPGCLKGTEATASLLSRLMAGRGAPLNEVQRVTIMEAISRRSARARNRLILILLEAL